MRRSTGGAMSIHEPRRSRANGRRAFTLVELVVVVGIISVLLAGVVPVFRATRDEVRRRSVVRRAVALLSLARSSAAATGRDHRVRVDAQRGTLTIEALPPPDEPVVTFSPARSLPGHQVGFPPPTVVETRRRGEGLVTDAFPLFHPDGTARPAELIVRDPSGAVSLLVDPATGRARIRPLEGRGP